MPFAYHYAPRYKTLSDEQGCDFVSSSMTSTQPSIPSMPWLFPVHCAQQWCVCSSVLCGHSFREPSWGKPNIKGTLSAWGSELWTEIFVLETLLRSKRKRSFQGSANPLGRVTLRKGIFNCELEEWMREWTNFHGTKEGLCLGHDSYDKVFMLSQSL